MYLIFSAPSWPTSVSVRQNRRRVDYYRLLTNVRVLVDAARVIAQLLRTDQVVRTALAAPIAQAALTRHPPLTPARTARTVVAGAHVVAALTGAVEAGERDGSRAGHRTILQSMRNNVLAVHSVMRIRTSPLLRQ